MNGYIKIFFHFLRVYGLLKVLFSRVTVDKSLVDAFSSKLTELSNSKSIDFVIPTCFPFEAVVGACDFKSKSNSSVGICAYLFDNFSLSKSLHRFDLNRKLKYRFNKELELKTLTAVDYVIAMHPLKAHLDSLFKKNVTYMEHPLLVYRSMNDKTSPSSKIRLCYSGGVFKRVREPDYMLKVIELLALDIDFDCDFFAFGNDVSKLAEFSRASSFASFHGRVSSSEVFENISKSDILLNLGEVEGKQISSKVFEYMSFGKPIVHFEYIQGCVVSSVLSKYPLALILNTNDVETVSVKKLADFIGWASKKSVCFDEVAEIYTDALPESTAMKIVEFVKAGK